MTAPPLLRAVPSPAHQPIDPVPFVGDRIALAESVICLAEHRFGGQHDDAETAGSEPPRGSVRRRHWIADLLIRLGGLVAIAIAAIIFTSLYRAAQAMPGREGTLGQYLLLAVGFLGASLGSGLIILGHHIHDLIEVSDRRRPRS